MCAVLQLRPEDGAVTLCWWKSFSSLAWEVGGV